MSFLTQNINFLLTYFRINNIVTSIMTSFLWQYSNIRVFLEDKYNSLYKNNRYFKSTIDYACTMQKYMKKKVFEELCEPEENIWTHFIYLTKLPDEIKYNGSYEIMDNVVSNETEYIESINLSNGFFDDISNKNLCCLVSKYNNAYHIRNREIILQNDEYFQKTNIDILSVVYSHPNMEAKIHIELPKEMLYCHNQLFNAAFVHYCLKYYNKETFIFDEDYTMEIMDSNVELYNLTYNHYLHVGFDQLEVRVI